MDMDVVLQNLLTVFNHTARIKNKIQKNSRWERGKPLRLLLAGYTGARNTGSDVRTAEMVRQFHHLLKEVPVEITVGTLNPQLTKGYFEGAKQVLIPQIFLPFVIKECPKYDGVIACEGSMFKSTFATALSTFMAGSLGAASAQNKVSIGYGAEAGEMGKNLKNFVRQQCKKSLIICRNEHSRTILNALNIRTASGTDTAWTFTPSPSLRGRELLRNAGWDEKQLLLAIAPINPFWWPVTPDLRKAFMNSISKKYKDIHYKSIYFHQYSLEDKEYYQRYINGIAKGVRAFCQRHQAFPILIGMELLDGNVCAHLAEKLGGNVPQFISKDYHMYDLISILCQSDLLLSSRFHAIVTSMPSLVPSAGITMDERIYNLMLDRGHAALVLKTNDLDLQEKVDSLLERLYAERDRIRQDIARDVKKHLKSMGLMGMDFLQELQSVYPTMPMPNLGSSWENYLPPISMDLQRLMEAPE